MVEGLTPQVPGLRPQERALALRERQDRDRRERLKARIKLIPIDFTLANLIAVGGCAIHEVQKVRVGIVVGGGLRREVLKVRQAKQAQIADRPASLFQDFARKRLQEGFTRFAPATG